MTGGKEERFPLRTRIEVEWVDSSSRGQWDSVEGYKIKTARALRIRSIGYLLRSDRSEIVLIQSMGVNADVADSVTIPRGCVKTVRRLSGGLK